MKKITKEDVELIKEVIDFHNLNHFKGKKYKKQLINIKGKLQALTIPVVSGSSTVSKKNINKFIDKWSRIIHPYDEQHDQKRAIKTVLDELNNLR